MTVSRQIALSLAFGLLLPGFALAAPNYGYEAQPASEPLAQVSQSLPPIQGTNGYQNGYQNNGYTGGYGNNPTYNNTYGNPSPGYQSQYNQVQPQYNNQSYGQQAPLQGYIMTAPPGTVMSASLSSPVSSEFARVGDRFTATLASPVASGNSVILPAGSQVEGQVVMVKPAGRAGKSGELEVRFTSAMLPNGQRVPLSARIQTEDGTGIIKGGTAGGRLGRAAVTTGVGAGLGAALGTAMGPLSGGGVGRGAIYGTALGAGMGALGAAFQKGSPAEIESGEPVNIVLDQPLTTSPGGGAGSSGYAQPNNYSQPAQDQQGFQYYQPGNSAPQNPQPYNYYGN